jgi:hypothetical protein
VLSNNNPSFGYIVVTRVYEDSMVVGIIDPTKVRIIDMPFTFCGC